MRLKSEELHTELVQEVLKIDPKEWVKTLERQSTFIDYSFQNTLMILTHWDWMRSKGVVEGELTTVAPRSRWRRRGRTIMDEHRRHGMPIFVPVTYKRKPKDSDEEDDDKSAPAARVFFRIRWVYDVTQTEGEPFERPHPKAVQGDDETADEYRAALVHWLAEQGITVEERPMQLSEQMDMTVQGYWSPSKRHIVVATRCRDGVALNKHMRLRVLIHEAAHATFGHTKSDPITEMEAESAAYIVGRSIGLDLGDYSFGYVSTWMARISDANDKGNLMLKAGSKITNVAVRLLKGMGFDPRKEPDECNTESSE